MSISRRGALLGASAAVAVAGVPAVVQAGETPGDISTAIQQRYAEWQMARQSLYRDLDNLAVVEQRACQGLPPRVGCC